MKNLSWIFLALMLSGCGTLSFPVLNAPKPPDQVYKYSQTIEKQPQVVQTSDGKSYVWESQKQTVDVNYEKKEKPLTWWQRFCNWLSTWSIIAVIIFIVLFFATNGGIILTLWNKYQKFKKGFTQTVAAIDASNAVATTPALKAALSAKQDNDVKALVDDTQQPGK